MNTPSRLPASLLGAALLAGAPVANSATVIPITSFDPTTFFVGATAGIDFDDDSDGATPGNQLVTQPGFASIPPSNNKTYNVTNNGITFDIQVTNANLGNQNRWRGAIATAGPLINDFEQWYGRYAASGSAVEATISLTGLLANTDYQVSFFTMNLGSGNTTHNFYEGTSSADPLITAYTTSGNNNNYATWSPGITFQVNSGSGGEMAVTIQAAEYTAGTNIESRLTLTGVSVVAIPEPAAISLLALGGLAFLRRRR